jgi:hypothetical protein
MRRVLARRCNVVERADGTRVAEAIADWIFTRDGVTMARIPGDFVKAFPSLQDTVAPLALQERPAPAGAGRTLVHIRHSDADAMGHANHPVFVDVLDDAVTRAGGAQAVAALPRTYDMQHDAAAEAGAELRDVAWRDNGVWWYRLEAPGSRLVAHGRLVPGRDVSARPRSPA